MGMRVKQGTPPNLINLAEESRSTETVENVGFDDDIDGYYKPQSAFPWHMLGSRWKLQFKSILVLNFWEPCTIKLAIPV